MTRIIFKGSRDVNDTCFAYDEHLRDNGHSIGGEALRCPETALTLSWKNGKVATTDGPSAETKEQLGRHRNPRGAGHKSCCTTHRAASVPEIRQRLGDWARRHERSHEGKWAATATLSQNKKQETWTTLRRLSPS